MEILNKEIRKYDGVADGLVTCIAYKEDEKEKHLINVCIVDGMLLPVYYITDNKRLFEFESTPWSEISDEDSALMEKLEKQARRPETKEEIEMAMMTIDMIREKCRELQLMDEEALLEDTTVW